MPIHSTQRADELWEAYDVKSLTLQEAAHLFRRAQFGGNWGELQLATQKPIGELVTQIVDGQDDPEFERQSRAMQSVIQSGNLPVQLPAWWLYRLQRSPRPALEKMVVFWHGHFATSAAKVASAPAMLQQNATLRSAAMGKFESLVLAISRDAAMLSYLDSATNRRNNPNENYARELLELFCLGLGNYSERDIRELARAFTGWEVQHGRFVFNAFQHDPAPKNILGKAGIESGEEAVAWIVAQPQASNFIARKLFRYYVSDHEPEAALIEPLAKCLHDNDFELRPALELIFRSRLFFSDVAYARKIRSPVELGIGLMRVLGAVTSPTQLATSLAELGQSLFYPPSVKGWDGGKQWINSATWIGRVNLVSALLDNPQTDFGTSRNLLDESCDARTSQQAVERVEQLWMAKPFQPSIRESLAKVVDSAGDNPSRLLATLKAASTLSDFQLG